MVPTEQIDRITEHIEQHIDERLDSRRHWHLDKRVPVALIVTLFIHLAVFVFTAGATWTQIKNQNERITRLEDLQVQSAAKANSAATNVAVLAEKVGDLAEQQAEIQQAVPEIQKSLARIEGELRTLNRGEK